MTEEKSGKASGEISEDWKRTAPAGIIARTLSGLQKSILPLVALMVGSGGFEQGRSVALVVIVASIAGNLLFSWITWRHHRYLLGTDDIRVEHGLISRHSRAVPYDRIQDVALHEAPLARLLGLVEVRFETGAGGKDELKLAYVTREQGAGLRDTVRARRDGARAAVALEEGMAAEQTLFAMDLPRLVTFGFFEFSLVVFAVLFGAVEQLDFLLPFDIWKLDGWMELLSGPGDRLARLGPVAQVIGAVFAVGLLALLGLVTGVTRTVLRDWGFRLERNERGLRRRRGLFTRSDMVMPVQRVQALKVTTGIVRRFLGGWHGLAVVSLAQDEKSAAHVIVPFARMAEIAPVVAKTGFALPPADIVWHRTSPAYHRNMALFSMLPLLAVAAGLLLVDPFIVAEGFRPQWIAAGFGAVAAVMGLRHYYGWRHDRFALDGAQVYVRRGWLAPRLDIASRVKVQSVELCQGPFGRSDGYATVRFGIAGGELELVGAGMEDAQAVQNAVLDSVAKLDFSRLPK